ncbi:hypothetical protein HDU98_008927 [Podochytrium sp. JEL0797]|nr:hypothetical protein HDU98_008927 [Podochytrium sp. JEL0797]
MQFITIVAAFASVAAAQYGAASATTAAAVAPAASDAVYQAPASAAGYYAPQTDLYSGASTVAVGAVAAVAVLLL